MMIFTFVCLRVKRDIGLPRFSLMGRLASRVDNTLRGRETRYLHASSRRRSDQLPLKSGVFKKFFSSHPRRKTDLLSRRRSSLRTSLSVCLDATRANNEQKRGAEVVLNGNSKNIRKEGLKEACKAEIQDKSGRTRVRLA